MSLTYKAPIQVTCPECGMIMFALTLTSIKCINSYCSIFNVHFKIPVITLEEISHEDFTC